MILQLSLLNDLARHHLDTILSLARVALPDKVGHRTEMLLNDFDVKGLDREVQLDKGHEIGQKKEASVQELGLAGRDRPGLPVDIRCFLGVLLHLHQIVLIILKVLEIMVCFVLCIFHQIKRSMIIKFALLFAFAIIHEVVRGVFLFIITLILAAFPGRKPEQFVGPISLKLLSDDLCRLCATKRNVYLLHSIKERLGFLFHFFVFCEVFLMINLFIIDLGLLDSQLMRVNDLRLVNQILQLRCILC